MVPVLKKMAEQECEIIALARQDSPAYKIFQSGGFTSKEFGLRFRSWEEENRKRAAEAVKMMQLLKRLRPDFVLVGVSTFNYGTEKMAVRCARVLGIPIAFLIVESWPHLWLTNFGKRDIPIYQRSDLIMVMDEISKNKMMEAGFDQEKIVITGNPGHEEHAKLQVDYNCRKEISKRVRSSKLGCGEEDLVLTFAITNNLERGQLDIEPTDPRWLGFRESEVLGEFLEAVFEIQKFRPCRAVIRIKPGREREPIQEIAHRLCPNALLIGEEVRDGKEVILASDVVVGTVSIFLQEANYLKVPAISYLPNLSRENPQEANRLGIVHTILGNLEEHRLQHCLLDLAAHQEQQMKMLGQKIKWLQLKEGASDRVVQALVGMFSYQYG